MEVNEKLKAEQFMADGDEEHDSELEVETYCELLLYRLVRAVDTPNT